MPYGKKKSKMSRRKRPYRRRRRKPRITRQLGELSDAQMCKLRYVDRFQLDASANTANSFVFSANGLFDPNITGTGHQPHLFDQWIALYDHYTVVGAKCTMSVAQGSAAATDFTYIGVNLKSSDSIDTTDIDTIMEQKKASIRQVGTGSTHATQTVTKYFSARKFFNQDVKNNDKFQGNNSANPDEGAFFHCFAAAQSPLDDPAPLKCVVVIDYIVRFSERRSIGSS